LLSWLQAISGNFLFDFRTSTFSIDRTAFLDKVLVDFVPHGSKECGERPVSNRRGRIQWIVTARSS
jgi:hypothetical protein